MRLSPERFGIRLAEALSVCEQLIAGGKIDFLDISLWDSFNCQRRGLSRIVFTIALRWLSRGKVLLTVAGKIMTAEHVRDVFADVDFVTIGRGAMHHDYPRQVMNNDAFEPIALPVSRAHLAQEGLSETFIEYMNGWKDLLQTDSSRPVH